MIPTDTAAPLRDHEGMDLAERRRPAAWYVYALIDPDSGEARYVGMTYDPARRLYEHCIDLNRSRPTHRTAWIKKLRSEGLRPLFAILDQAPTRNEALQKEAEWERQTREEGASLTNSVPTGFGGFDAFERAESRRKMSNSQRAAWSPERRAAVGRKVREEFRSGLRQSSLKLTADQASALIRQLAAGRAVKEVAAEFGVSREIARRVGRTVSWQGLPVWNELSPIEHARVVAPRREHVPGRPSDYSRSAREREARIQRTIGEEQREKLRIANLRRFAEMSPEEHEKWRQAVIAGQARGDGRPTGCDECSGGPYRGAFGLMVHKRRTHR